MRFLYLSPLLLALHGAVATVMITPDRLINDIKEVELMKNLKALQRIADRNGGNRAFGLPGFRASADYVLERANRFKRTIDVREQEFEALFAIVDEIELREDGKEPIYVFGLTYSPSTDDAGISAPLALGPAGLAGCDASGYAGNDVNGKIVLVERFR